MEINTKAVYTFSHTHTHLMSVKCWSCPCRLLLLVLLLLSETLQCIKDKIDDTFVYNILGPKHHLNLCPNKVNDIMLGTSCTTVSKYSDNVLLPYSFSLATLHPFLPIY